MPRPKSNKLYRTFSKGLITEAGFLTYPENASTDELNTVIKTKGSRSRRFGIDYEQGSLSVAVDSNVTQLDVASVYSWRAVNNDSSVNFLCVQVKGKIYFYDLDAVPITGATLPFTLDLTAYASPTALSTDVQGEPVQMSSGKGYLFVASKYIEPLICEYAPLTGTLAVLPITILMRDFDGVADSLANEFQPTSLSNLHYYNLRNQGWVQPGTIGVVSGTQTGSNTGAAPGGTTVGTWIDPNDGTVRTRFNL